MNDEEMPKKSCPFCGGKETDYVMTYNKESLIAVASMCAKCGARGPEVKDTSSIDDHWEADRLWNERVK